MDAYAERWRAWRERRRRAVGRLMRRDRVINLSGLVYTTCATDNHARSDNRHLNRSIGFAHLPFTQQMHYTPIRHVHSPCYYNRQHSKYSLAKLPTGDASFVATNTVLRESSILQNLSNTLLSCPPANPVRRKLPVEVQPQQEPFDMPPYFLISRQALATFRPNERMKPSRVRGAHIVQCRFRSVGSS